jgi:hypothetical protein
MSIIYASSQAGSNPNNPLANGATNTEKPPPKSWWQQKGVAVLEGVAVAVAGLGFAAYFEISGRPGDLAAGAAFGLAVAIGIGGLFAVHDQWELLTELHRMSLALNQQKRIIIERRGKAAALRTASGCKCLLPWISASAGGIRIDRRSG